MTYVGENGVYTAIYIAMWLLAVVGMIIGVIMIFDTDSDSNTQRSGIVLILLSVVLAIFGFKCAFNPQYVIQVDDSVTVEELTDTFIVHNYDATDDVWIVCQKKGGLNPKDLEKSKDES